METVPVLHGIDNNGAPWGVSILSRQYGMTAVGDANAQFDYRIVVHHKNSAASGEYHATWANGVAVKKDGVEANYCG